LRVHSLVLRIAGAGWITCAALAQAPSQPGASAQAQTQPASVKLTLGEAEQRALKNHPRVSSAVMGAQAENRVVAEARSAYYPTGALNITSAAANDGTTLAAGALTTSSLNTRFASGLNLVQLVTDFGRTTNLVNAAKFRYQAANDSVMNTRAQILLEVRRAYFGVLGSEAVLRAAQATLQARQVTLRQITALAQSLLRSTLDVTFAEVLVSEAQLAVDQAENDVQSSRAALGAAIGSSSTETATLDDEPVPGPLNPDLSSLVADALRDRPDLNLVEHNRDAAYQFAESEKKLRYPTVSLLATAGAIPEHDHTIPRDNYEAAGINVNIPIFNGGLFAARQTEASLRAKAADKDVQDLSINISRDVRMAWFNANNAYRRLSVTTQLVDQARLAFRLAQQRYSVGLGSIVELNQAQTSEISAEINAASAKYDYLSRRTELDFTIGAIR
jgi:outer membrane protein